MTLVSIPVPHVPIPVSPVPFVPIPKHHNPSAQCPISASQPPVRPIPVLPVPPAPCPSRFGRRALLTWCYLQLGVAGASTAAAPTFVIYCLCRFLGGLAMAGVSLNSASLCELGTLVWVGSCHPWEGAWCGLGPTTIDPWEGPWYLGLVPPLLTHGRDLGVHFQPYYH